MQVPCVGEDEGVSCTRLVRIRRETQARLCPDHKPRRIPRTRSGRLGTRARLQVLIAQDLYDWMHAEAARTGQSLNQFADRVLDGVRSIRGGSSAQHVHLGGDVIDLASLGHDPLKGLFDD